MSDKKTPTENKIKNKVIIFGCGEKFVYYRYMFGEIPNDGDTIYEYACNNLAEYLSKHKFSRFLHRINFSERLKKIIPYRLKARWVKKEFRTKIGKSESALFFVLQNNPRARDKEFLRALKYCYKNSKTVFYITNLIETHPEDIEYLKSIYDEVASFSENDAAEYNFIYRPLCFPHPTAKIINDNHAHSDYVPDERTTNEYVRNKCTLGEHTFCDLAENPAISLAKDSDKGKSFGDVFFCGQNKNRAELILSIAKNCNERGLKADFFIIDENADLINARIKKENISGVTCVNHLIHYDEVYKHMLAADCFLELVPFGIKGAYTLRFIEAVALGKKLLTNNHKAVDSPLYSPAQTQVFENAENIDYTWLKIQKGEKEKFCDPDCVSPERFFAELRAAVFK
mgnify:CR=1 FL=1